MTRIAHAVYLHGFTSSPDATKATWFRERLAGHGVSFSCPDFNEPEFESLTITRMIGQTAEAVQSASTGPIALIGSSLGAFVAVHAANLDQTDRIDRLVLLAPALDFGGNRLKQLGPHSIEEWRQQGYLTIPHHALGGSRRIGFGLYEDAAQYDALALDLGIPTLAFQGRQDELVDAGMVELWARRHPSVRLHVVDDGHQLRGAMERIWEECRPFLGL